MLPTKKINLILKKKDLKCIAYTLKGVRCSRKKSDGDYCKVHINNHTHGTIHQPPVAKKKIQTSQKKQQIDQILSKNKDLYVQVQFTNLDGNDCWIDSNGMIYSDPIDKHAIIIGFKKDDLIYWVQ